MVIFAWHMQTGELVDISYTRAQPPRPVSVPMKAASALEVSRYWLQQVQSRTQGVKSHLTPFPDPRVFAVRWQFPDHYYLIRVDRYSGELLYLSGSRWLQRSDIEANTIQRE